MTVHVTMRTYVVVFATLMFLTALTVLMAFVHLGRFNDVVALTIAVTKATAVLLYFMHVRYGRPLVWLVAIAGFMWLALLIGGVATDYFSRGLLAPPPPVVLPDLPRT